MCDCLSGKDKALLLPLLFSIQTEVALTKKVKEMTCVSGFLPLAVVLGNPTGLSRASTSRKLGMFILTLYTERMRASTSCPSL